MSRALWTGQLSEKQFWTWLREAVPVVGEEDLRRMLDTNLAPLPAMSLLQQWNRFADLHLLSNHRTEWILPALEAVKPYFASMTVSSAAGSAKPHPDIYARVAALLPEGVRVLFVDDQDKNLRQAGLLGWSMLKADPAGL